MQTRQIALKGLPHDLHVHLIVAVRDAVAHGVHHQPGNLIVPSRELRSYALDMVRRLTN